MKDRKEEVEGCDSASQSDGEAPRDRSYHSRRDVLRRLSGFSLVVLGVFIPSVSHATEPENEEDESGGASGQGGAASGEDHDCPEQGAAPGTWKTDSDCGMSDGQNGYHTDSDCGLWSEHAASSGNQDNDCSDGQGSVPFSYDSDCGIATNAGDAHPDQDCGVAIFSTDSDCGKSAGPAYIHHDADCPATYDDKSCDWFIDCVLDDGDDPDVPCSVPGVDNC